MATAQDLIDESLAILGTYDAGGSPSSAERASDLKTLNFMRQSLAMEPGFQAKSEDNFTLSPGIVTYDWYNSSAANFSGLPAIKLTDVYASFNLIDYPLRGMSWAEVAQLTDKNYRTGIPDRYFYEQIMTTGWFSLYPAPSISGDIVIASIKAPSALVLSGDVDEPGQVLEALIWNLSVRLAPKYGVRITPEIAATAVTSMQRVKLSRMDDTVRVRGDRNFL